VLGFKSVDELLALTVDEIERLNLEVIQGIDHAKAERIKAVLKANRTGHASKVPVERMPKRAQTEIYIDVETLNGSLNRDFINQWEDPVSVNMIFMIGCGWREGGEFHFRRFTAEAETHEAEAKMLRQFLTFLRANGVFDPSRTTTLFCFSSAEQVQMKKAAERHGLSRLLDLEDKWFDVLEVFTLGPVAIPKMWTFSLKAISQALGEYAERYAVEYGDEVCDGGGAMVAAWAAYDTVSPLKHPAMKLVAEYLETDVLALCNTVMWLRAVCRQQTAQKNKRAFSWYSMVRCGMNPADEVIASTPGAGFWFRTWQQTRDLALD
jgi:hypothetical protein